MRVLFICTGNVCRSPLAEGYLKFLVSRGGLPDVEVQSAGVAALTGAPPFECAISVAQEFKFDISSKIACQLTPDLIRSSDRIFCMETWQAQAVMQMDPHSVKKVALLGSFHPEGRPLHQIPDPAEFDFDETLRTFQAIKAAVEGFYRTIASQVPAD
jgi:glycine hydroxymethyltransferase